MIFKVRSQSLSFSLIFTDVLWFFPLNWTFFSSYRLNKEFPTFSFFKRNKLSLGFQSFLSSLGFVHIFPTISRSVKCKRSTLTSSVPFLPLWSPSFSSSHQTEELCLQVLVVSIIVHPCVRGKVEKKPHLRGRQQKSH